MELFVTAALPYLKCLRALDLGYNSIGPAGARTLVEGLTGVAALASSLTALSLRINVLGDAGVATIASALHRLPNIQHLDLCNNWIQSAGAEALAGGLRGLKNLSTLDVSKNNIKTAGLAFISAVLVELQSVTQVCLSKNSIDEHGGASARTILQCPQLVFCDLSCNRLGPLGAAQVAGGLADAQRLEHIDLDCNELGAVGALLFAKAMMSEGHDARRSDVGMSAPASALVTGAHTVGLRHLHLFNNRMGAEGAFHLASILSLFPLLCSLDLGHQFMYAAGAADLAEALPACLSLESLSLNNNFIGLAPSSSHSSRQPIMRDGQSCALLPLSSLSPNPRAL
jgi:Ran GTPase-activating protein (RanGAP) involved in mRNA processing and transport